MRRAILRVWSLWFYVLFLGYFAVMFPFYVLFISIRRRWAHNIAHGLNTLWGYVITLPAGVRVQAINRDKIDPQKVYIFAPNHTSYLDIPACNVAIPITYRYVGKAELNDIPFFGWMFKRLYISVDRGSRMDSYRSFRRAAQKLKEGTSVLIYPEGTIPDKTKVVLKRFKDGAFRLAVENRVPIVPTIILNADKVLPDNGTLLLHPGKVKVIFHDPIQVTGEEDPNELKQRVYNIMMKYLEEDKVRM